jgi:putative ABC transport system permease protein
MGWIRRLRNTIVDRPLQEEFDAEARAYFDERVREGIRRGLTRVEAEMDARRDLGNLALARDEARDADTLRWLDDVWRDLRYAVRLLRRTPLFSAAAVCTLALGVGAATTMFSVIQNVLLDPFPYKDADRVAGVLIQDLTIVRPGGRTAFPLAEFLDYQQQNHVFEEVIGGGHEDVLMATGDGTEQFDGAYVTPNTFQFLGVPALLGRGLLPDDAAPGTPAVFVMSYKMWRGRYSLDPAIIGRAFTLNGVPTTLVGIMPPRFTKFAADLWRAVPLDRGDPEVNQRSFRLQARLKPGLSFKQAEADLEPIARRLAATYPRNYPNRFSVQVVSWVDSLVFEFRTTLYSLAAAVAFLLLISCSNVGNMLLARATARDREFAVRTSLGASRWRVIRQLLIESSLLALAGALLGGLVAYLGIESVKPLMPATLLPSEVVIGLNRNVLVFALALTVLTSILCGLVPALQVAKRDVVQSLNESARGSSAGRAGRRFTNALVVAEVGLSLALLMGAGVLMRTAIALQRVDLGIDPDRILIARVSLPPGQYTTASAKRQFFQTVLGRLRGLPGVVAATESTGLPTSGVLAYGRIVGEVDVPGLTHSDRWDALYQLCSEGYFPTLNVRVVSGRALSEVDVVESRRVAVVNQTAVARYFGSSNPIGRRIKLSLLQRLPTGAVADPMFEVVGVAADVKNRGLQETPLPEVLVPYTITGAFDRSILVKTSGDPGSLINSVRREIWAVDRSAALAFAGTLSEYLTLASYAAPRFSAIVSAVFASLGLILAVVGIYSVIGYVVSQRTHEIGIRMALGATRADVLWMVVRMSGGLVGAGILVGVLTSIGMARLIQSQVWGVSPYDPSVLLGVVVVLVASALLASYLPARKATRVDPVIALKIE